MALMFEIRGTQSVTIVIMPDFIHLAEADIAERLSDGELILSRGHAGQDVIRTEDGKIVALSTDVEFAGITKDFDSFDLV